MDVDHTIHLGGLETLDSFYPDPENDDPNFMGCMRNLYLNGKAYPLTKVSEKSYEQCFKAEQIFLILILLLFQESGWNGLSIDDCDGTACGGEVCLHEGVCVLEENRPEGYNCECLDEFRGRNCEIHSLCEDNGGCQNGATCRVEEERSEVICDCAYGYVGDFCEIGKNLLSISLGTRGIF